jgi:hypothetical protein
MTDKPRHYGGPYQTLRNKSRTILAPTQPNISFCFNDLASRMALGTAHGLRKEV